ncbi:hypothetical protein RRG08_051357 [Elysia crispata]|uniref:Uncharacterized protein n=1 Tax=Elysia crispata TaxID=231223 RepID=A0AAE1B542_9GAST|nr:hypothetical protein RRG08_051357 [Elysia crispata]
MSIFTKFYPHHLVGIAEKSNPPCSLIEGGAKSWHGRPVRTTNQIKCLLDGCDDWDVSADLPEWDSHPSIIKETRLRPDIVIHSTSTQQLIMVELTVPYENRMEEAHIYKREKYMKLTEELENAGYKAVVMPVEDNLAKWYSAGISNPSIDEGMGSNPGAVRKKKKKTPGSHDLGVARPP